MSDKSALDTAGMLCFFVYWVCNCAFLVIPVPKMRVLVYVKFVVYWVAVFAMLGWTVALARNGEGTSALTEGSTISGSAKAWTVAKFFWLGLASCGTFISNAADFQRYARKPNDTWLGQVVSFPLSNFIIAIVGNVIAASSKGIFGRVSTSHCVSLLLKTDAKTSSSGIRSRRSTCSWRASDTLQQTEQVARSSL
jgi:NCS1 family nucleobase:cation symporter-1